VARVRSPPSLFKVFDFKFKRFEHIVPTTLAERVGFEPTNTVRCYTLSRRAPSTARPPLLAVARVPERAQVIKSTDISQLRRGRDCCGPILGRSPSGRRCASSKIAPGDFVEPTNTVRCYTLSRRAPSTARPPLHTGRKGTGADPDDQIQAPLVLRHRPVRTGIVTLIGSSTRQEGRDATWSQSLGRATTRWPPCSGAPACSVAERRNTCP
jgi:hypothetical protein